MSKKIYLQPQEVWDFFVDKDDDYLYTIAENLDNGVSIWVSYIENAGLYIEVYVNGEEDCYTYFYIFINNKEECISVISWMYNKYLDDDWVFPADEELDIFSN